MLGGDRVSLWADDRVLERHGGLFAPQWKQALCP